MKKTLLSGIALLSVSIPTFAGGILTNTSQNILFLRMLARDASTRVDAVYYNPAGTAFLTDGFHLSLNNQSAFQTRKINSQFPLFKHNGGEEVKTYLGKATAPFIPSFMGVYKKDRFSISTHFGLTGGGGKAIFEDGLPSMEYKLAGLVGKVNSNDMLKNFGINRYSSDNYMAGSQYNFGLQVGASYKINDIFSLYGGARLNYSRNSYEGYVRDIRLGTKMSPQMLPVADLMKIGMQHLAANGINIPAEALSQYAKAGNDKNLSVAQTGWGVTPIVGVNAKLGPLNIGAKYEFLTSISLKNEIKQDNFELFSATKENYQDIPSLLTIGAEYEFTNQLRASVGFHHYFEKQARMNEILTKEGIMKAKNELINGGTNEYLFGIEYDVLSWLQLSAGTQITDHNVSDEYQQDSSFSLDSYSIGFGAGIKISPKATINIAYLWTNYDKHENNTIPAIKNTYSRTNSVFGLGIDYKF